MKIQTLADADAVAKEAARLRRVLWLVTGAEKLEMLPRLRAADPSIPAGRVRQEHALVLADRVAAAAL
jgi:6-phosphogluconolactonase